LKSATIKYLFAIFSYFKNVDKEETDDEIKRILHPIACIGEADEVRNEMVKNKRISRDFFVYSIRQNNFEKRKTSWSRFLDDWEKI
jgi:superfamily I DNA/RNA helicase